MPSGKPGSGPFMLTLCRLAAPVAIRPPQAPQFKPFTFFVSRGRDAGGSEHVLLNMGYFATLAEAQRWGQLLRSSYPQAVATLAPDAHLRQPDSGVPTLKAAQQTPPRRHAPIQNLSLTDTQVLRVLETRRPAPTEDVTTEETAGITLVRPDDTKTRRALKEAVVQGAPVSFAVQLQWSVQPIDLGTVPGLSIFRAYKLYVTQQQREGRSWHCLRLGFFDDAISAKQVAYYVRSTFASVAVVPVTEEETARAEGNRVDLAALADPATLAHAQKAAARS
jgi:hypothetical protein